MFQDIKLGVDVSRYFCIFGLLFPKIGHNFIQFSGHTDCQLGSFRFVSLHPRWPWQV
jgi:hypothetical protein